MHMFDSTRLRSAVVMLCGVTLFCATFAATAEAQPRNRKTTVTFSQPFEIPGVSVLGSAPSTLPAGTYVFTLVDSLSDRNVVRIFSRDEKTVHATILAIPNYRLRSTDKTVMTFQERAAGEPQAIRAWFYPGDNSGQEFVYPKKRALELAKITQTPILYIPDDVAAAPAVEVALKAVPVRAVTPIGEDVDLSQVVEAPPARVAGLPKTAGVAPFFALMGLLSMGVGFSLKKLCDC